MIVTVTPNPSLDRTYRLDRLRPGELHRAEDSHTEPSGKGVNVSRVLRRLGVATRAVHTAGGFEGAALTALLERRMPGLATAVPVAGPTRHNVTLLTADGAATKVNEPGWPLSTVEADRLVAAVRDAVAGARWLACCGSLPPGTDPALPARLVAAAHEAGARAAVDTSGAPLAAAARARADLLAPNAAELSELTGVTVDSVETAARTANDLRARCGADLLVSLGPEGAVLVGDAGTWHAAPPRIRALNATGAGDALLAGYLAATGGPAAALAAAVAVGTSACLAGTTGDLPERLIGVEQVTLRRLDGGTGSSPSPSPSTEAA